MNEPKHTPGPWDYDCDSGGCYFKLSAGEEAIIDCCDFCSTPTINNEANARLIAAAPELLNALESIAEFWNKDQDWGAMNAACWHAIETAEAAIAKAKGEQP